MLDYAAIYDALYLLAARDGREEALFGNCQPFAREAFSRSLIGDEFPIVCFEVPLTGAPRFDLHVPISRSALVPGTGFAPGAGGGYDDLFRWYSEEEAGGCGLAFALFCAPTFVKLRVRDGEPFDAKAYLQAGARGMGRS